MNDSLAIQNILNGKDQYFEHLMTKYQKQLYHIAYNIVRNGQKAEDIVQDAFFQAFEKLDTLKEHDGFYPWIKKITVNMSLNVLQKDKRSVSMSSDEEGGDDFFEKIPSDITPEDCALQDELKKRVQSLLNGLPDKFRAILIMRELEDMSYEEISELTGLPVGTIRSRLHHARQALKEKLIAQGFIK